MSWTYTFGANSAVDYVRLLIPDTNSAKPIFQDEEIRAFGIITSQVWQSSMLYSGVQGAGTLPSLPVSYLRIAALALDTLANNSARLAIFTEVLDIKMDPSKSADALAKRANALRAIDDNSGAFVIIEQVRTQADYHQRYWSGIQRQIAA